VPIFIHLLRRTRPSAPEPVRGPAVGNRAGDSSYRSKAVIREPRAQGREVSPLALSGEAARTARRPGCAPRRCMPQWVMLRHAEIRPPGPAAAEAATPASACGVRGGCRDGTGRPAFQRLPAPSVVGQRDRRDARPCALVDGWRLAAGGRRPSIYPGASSPSHPSIRLVRDRRGNRILAGFRLVGGPSKTVAD
jgi:hypothetical protein